MTTQKIELGVIERIGRRRCLPGLDCALVGLTAEAQRFAEFF